jgi:integrase
MASKALTDIAIRNLKPGPARREIPDPGARGLYVIVHTSGKKSFAARYRHAGLPRKLTLQGGISLSMARKLCADAMHEVAQGRDPAQAKQTAKTKAILAKADTVQAICEEYMAREGRKLRTGHVRHQDLRRLVYPEIGGQQIDSLKRSQIVRLLDKIEDKHGPRAADLVLAYLRRVFNWHASRSDEFRSPVVRGMGRFAQKDHARSRVLEDDELRAVWQVTATGGAFASLLRFLLLTACRRGEAAGLTWAEIEGDRWRLPESRNKTKQELVRPLSKTAQAILAAQPRVADQTFVFTNGHRPLGFSLQKKNFDIACGVRDWRLHDLRRTAKTLLSRAGVSPDVAERCLGHAVGGVRGVYDRHSFEPEMAHAFEALAAQIERIINPPAGVVTPLRKRGHG